MHLSFVALHDFIISVKLKHRELKSGGKKNNNIRMIPYIIEFSSDLVPFQRTALLKN